MSNNISEPVELVLGEHTFHLKYTMAALKRFKKLTGKSVIADGLSGVDEEIVPELIHAGLVERDAISPDDLSELIDTRNLKYVMECFAKAFSPEAPLDKPVEPQQ